MAKVPDLSQIPPKQFAQPQSDHISLGGKLRFVLFIVPFLLFLLWVYQSVNYYRGMDQSKGIVLAIIVGIIWKLLVSGIRVAAQWERGVILFFGNFKSVRGPGLLYVIPIIEYVRFIDMRTLVVNIPSQKVITRDNVPAEIDGALFFMVKDSEKAVVSIQDFRFAISQYAQASLRDVVGAMSLDELLSEREEIQMRIGQSLEDRVQQWGLHVDSIRLQDIELPEDLKRMMSRQASAEREKRATITKSEGDKLAAENLAQAAEIMRKTSGALQLRTLQTIDGLGASPSNTVVLFPLELTSILGSITVKSKENPIG